MQLLKLGNVLLVVLSSHPDTSRSLLMSVESSPVVEWLGDPLFLISLKVVAPISCTADRQDSLSKDKHKVLSMLFPNDNTTHPRMRSSSATAVLKLPRPSLSTRLAEMNEVNR